MSGSKNILLVEDDAISSKMVKDFLSFRKYNVISIDNGNDVIPTLNSKNINLILLDLQISGINGNEVAKIIKGNLNFKKIPLFIVSAHNEEKIITELKEVEYEEIVEKPIVFKNFIILIEKYLNVQL